jgi:hypothetical protein
MGVMSAPSLLEPPVEDPPKHTGVQVMGDPLPWPRAGTRITPGGGALGVRNASPRALFKAGWIWQPWIKFYTPAEATERQELIATLWRAGDFPFFAKEQLVFRAEFIFARPAGHYGTGRNSGTIKPQHLGARPSGVGHKNADGNRTGGDIDNLVKLILDSLNKVAYADDGQVVRVEAEKCFTDQADTDAPQTIFDLVPITSARSAFF